MKRNQYHRRVHPFEKAIREGRELQTGSTRYFRRCRLVHTNTLRASGRYDDAGDVLRMATDTPAAGGERALLVAAGDQEEMAVIVRTGRSRQDRGPRLPKTGNESAGQFTD